MGCPPEDAITLHNIATSEKEASSGNPHKAVAVGKDILNEMTGQNAMQFSFRKSDQVETLGQNVLPSNDETVEITHSSFFKGW